MNQLEAGRKRQQFRGQYGYGYKKTGWVCLQNISDYSPFGAALDGRTMQDGFYRYSFQGQEHDDEVKGNGNSYTTEFRQYDPRVGRWLSIDLLKAEYPMMSPYISFDNNPIYFVDPLGLEGVNPGDPEKTVNHPEIKVTAKASGKSDTFFNKIGNFFRQIKSEIIEFGKQVGAFGAGVSNAVGSNNLLGFGRQDSNNFGKYSNAAHMGQRLGDYISIAQGTLEVVIGTTGNIIGGALDATGVGAVVGIPLNAGSTALSIHGVTVFSTATASIIIDNMESSTSDKMNDEGGSSKGSSSDKGVYKTPKKNLSGKEGSKDIPDWAKGNKPKKGENGDQFARRLLNKKYGKGNYDTKSQTEYSRIKKWGDRAFE